MHDLFRTTDIAALHEMILSGEMHLRDLAQCTITHTEQLDPKYHVWVEHDPQSLLLQAEESQKNLQKTKVLRLLEGVPVGVKDVFNTMEYPTQMGSPLWQDFTPGNDARVIYYIRNGGGLVAGKTTTAEFAVHAETKTLNPFDSALTPGTSSSGSAVAVALGIVPVALGTQTGASITRPASFCGVYGYKPSFGLLPRTGVLKTTDSLDTIGFFTARCGDLRRVFEALRVRGNDYPLSNSALGLSARQNKPKERPWRVLFAKTHTWANATEEARALLLAYVKRLASQPMVEIIEVELPREMERCHERHATIYDKSLAYYFKNESRHDQLISQALNDMIAHGKQITPADFQAALSEQEHLCRLMDDLLSGYDIVISLSTGESAPLRDAFPKPDPGLMWTMLHLPSISAPCLTTSLGLPLGVQFAARRHNDYLLLNFLEEMREMDLVPAGPSPLCPCP